MIRAALMRPHVYLEVRMARKLLAEYVCDRCKRTWFEPYTEGTPEVAPPKLEIKLTGLKDGDKNVAFSVLCATCVKSILGHIDGIGKELKKQSPERGKKESVATAKPGEAQPPAVPPAAASATPTPKPAGTSSAGSSGAKSQAKQR